MKNAIQITESGPITVTEEELCPGLEPEPQVIDTAAAPATPPAVISLSTEQRDAVDAAINGPDNLLILGKAGVGKSTVIREIKNGLNVAGKNFLLAAPTGVAAINVGGETVHRLISRLARFSVSGAPIIDVVIIDEDSMMRADLFDRLDTALRAAMYQPTLPFGGVRLVLVGDPGQLPPVVKKGEADSEYVLDNYLTPYFWSAACYAQATWKVIELTKVFRQAGDDRYPKLLNLVRKGDTAKPLAWLNKFRRTHETKGVILTGTNKDAGARNTERLASLPGTAHTFRAKVWGKIERSEYPTEEFLSLKVGARVMVIRNIYNYEGYEDGAEPTLELVNGDVGEILTLESSEPKPMIMIRCTRTGTEHVISLCNWEKEESKYDSTTKKIERECVGGFTQFPLRLAWACTIHKSQGATLDEFTLDVRRPLFAPGQAYVALSRGVSLDRCWIHGSLRPSDIQVCPHVAAFLADFRTGVGVKKGSAFDSNELECLVGKTEQTGIDDPTNW